MDDIIVSILNAVKQDPMNPMWPSGYTWEMIRILIDEGLLEYKKDNIPVTVQSYVRTC